MYSVEAIVIAGGLGTRLGTMAELQQKCLIQVEGKPILGHILDSLVAAFGSVTAIVAVGYLAESVVDYLSKNTPKNVHIIYSPHVGGTQPWGVYRQAVKLVDKRPFIATPGDIIALPELYSELLANFTKNQDAVATLSMSPDLEIANTHGLGEIENGILTQLYWPPPVHIDAKLLRDMTIWSSDSRITSSIDKFPFPGKSLGYTFARVIANHENILGYRYDKQWVHYGYPTDFEKPLPKITQAL